MCKIMDRVVAATAGITAVASLLIPAPAFAAEELVTLQTRDGVTQTFLLGTPSTRPAAIAVLFPGGYGNIRLRMEGGQIQFGAGNFLVRSRAYFVDGGVATAVADAPSDQPQGMEDYFRLGDKHTADIAAIVAELNKRFADTPVYLIGTSRGTLSAASGGRALTSRLAGVVLTSTMFLGARSGRGLSGFDFATIPAPLLFVHHIEDGCFVTPYRNAKSLADKYPLVTVQGGDPARSDPCEAFSAHGYLGKERETVEAIVNWILKSPTAPISTKITGADMTSPES